MHNTDGYAATAQTAAPNDAVAVCGGQDSAPTDAVATAQNVAPAPTGYTAPAQSQAGAVAAPAPAETSGEDLLADLPESDFCDFEDIAPAEDAKASSSDLDNDFVDFCGEPSLPTCEVVDFPTETEAQDDYAYDDECYAEAIAV